MAIPCRIRFEALGFALCSAFHFGGPTRRIASETVEASIMGNFPPAASRAGAEPIGEIDVLWLTAGLGCDGDTIAATAATQPSIEDIVLGTFPWIPKVNFHNPFLAYENGDEFVRYFREAAEGRLSPFILVVEGSIPNEQNKAEGDWAADYDMRMD